MLVTNLNFRWTESLESSRLPRTLVVQNAVLQMAVRVCICCRHRVQHAPKRLIRVNSHVTLVSKRRQLVVDVGDVYPDMRGVRLGTRCPISGDHDQRIALDLFAVNVARHCDGAIVRVDPEPILSSTLDGVGDDVVRRAAVLVQSVNLEDEESWKQVKRSI